MNETTKTKATNLEDLQLSVQDIYNRGGFGNVGTCNTAAATAAKAVTLGTIFSLSTGCVLLIRFTNGIESENSTLAITHTTLAGTTVTEDAKPIYLNDSALEANIIPAGASILLRYNGTQFDIVGGGGQASDAYTKAQTNALLNQKVDKENGKGLSTNDYDAASKTKLNALPNNSELTSLLGGKQAVITNGAEIGFGLATCATAGNVQAKEVTITNFVLKENAFVSVLFTNGFTVSNPTLNINNTGAKPIKTGNAYIPIGKVKNNTVLSMVYDGTNWNVVSIETLNIPSSEAIDLGLPSGTLWCAHNIGAVNPEDSGLYFSWGNTEGHAAGSGYIFNTDNYKGTSGYSVVTNISAGELYDAARAVLGNPWRMPTRDDFSELVTNCSFVKTTINNVNGFLLTSNVNGNSIFFPLAGYYQKIGGYEGNVLQGYGSWGQYWTSNLFEEGAGFCNFGYQNSIFVNWAGNRTTGFTIRAVQ